MDGLLNVDEVDGVQVGAEPVPGVRLRCICRGHQRTITSITWAPGGRFIASSAMDKAIRIWDAKNGDCLRVLEGHDAAVMCAAWSPHGTVLVTGSEDQTIRVWSLSDGKEGDLERDVRSFALRLDATIQDVCWWQNNIVIAGNDKSVHVWRTDIWEHVISISGFDENTCCVRCSPSGRLLAVGDIGGGLTLIETGSWTKTEFTHDHSNALLDAIWSQNESMLLTAGADHKVLVRDPYSGQKREVIEGHSGYVVGLAFSRESTWMATKSADGKVRIFKGSDWRLLGTIAEPCSGFYAPRVATQPGHDILATFGEEEKVVRVWEVHTQKLQSIARDVDIVQNFAVGKTTKRSFDDPIRLLHLSDLHFSSDTSPQASLVPLLQDIRKGLTLETVDYVVISGDLTHCGSAEGLNKARQFVEELTTGLGLSPQRCIVVPGNHDVEDLSTAYVYKLSAELLPDDQYVKQGDAYLVLQNDAYQQRLKRFSDDFFSKVVGQPYPLDPRKQGISYLFDDAGIQFLALNSAWQIDQFHRKRSALNPDAVARVIAEADKQIKDVRDRGSVAKSDNVLRLCVWHHSIQHRETMLSTDSVELLLAAGVRLCLHGDVHEMNREQFKYWYQNKLDVVGVGSFGSPAEGRPESTPRLYNMLEIQRDLSSVRVHTRRQLRPAGPWEGWYEWDDPNGTGRVPYYDIHLTRT